MSGRLLPCPFCGGEAEYHGECDMVAVRCSNCGAGTSGWWDEPEEAAEEWNRRPDRWIPVTERLPEEGETILVWHKDGYIMLLVNMFDEMEDVTHWRPLPAGPENGLEGRA